MTDPTPDAGNASEPTAGAAIGNQDLAKAEARFRSGASWFYWLAGLSIINSIIMLANGEWSFLFGLGATQIVDAFAAGIGAGAPEIASYVKAAGFGINLVVAGSFVFFGWLAHKRKNSAFVIGMLFYAMDALIFLLVKDYLGLAFHGWVLFSLFGGFSARRELAALESTGARAAEPA